MTTIYEGMSDVDLATEIAELTAAKRVALRGGEVEEVRGEGRALKYTRANMGELDKELKIALRERERRGGDGAFGALQVEF